MSIWGDAAGWGTFMTSPLKNVAVPAYALGKKMGQGSGSGKASMMMQMPGSPGMVQGTKSGGSPIVEGSPDYPGYSAGYDPATDALAGTYDQRLQGVQMDPRGLDAFRDQALRTGPSAWANLSRKDQRMQEQGARERGAKEMNSQFAQGADRLAATGGLSSGARERLAQSGQQNYLAMSQEAAHQGNANNLQIGINDEQNRISQLGQLPGMELAAIQPDLQKSEAWYNAANQDRANTIGENDKRTAFNMNLYNEQMKAWAADRQATATENSGKK